MNLKQFTGWIGLTLWATVVLLLGTWCSLAVWFRLPAGEVVRGLLAGAIVIFVLVTVGCLATSRRWLVSAAYIVLFALVFVWWETITPTNQRNWAPDVARNVTAIIDGDLLVVNNVRDFTWRSDTDFDRRWERRTYNLSRVTGIDLILSYWAGEAIAHTIVSFEFADGARLAFSVEIRKERGEAFSSQAGFFKQYELVVVAADERDVVRVRSNIRREDVRIYRLRMTPANAQLLLREYVKEVNGLARAPRFYNTLTANCTTLVFDLVRVVHPGLPLDRRVLLSGYLPGYLYDLGAVDTSVSLDKLRELSRIHDRAVLADDDPDFSARIRKGVPAPR